MRFRNRAALMLDLDGRIAFASTYFSELIGAEHLEMVGKSCFDFVFHDDMETARKLFHVNSVRYAAPVRLRLRQNDGSEVWTDVVVAPMQTASGEVYGMTATITAAPTNGA